MPKEGFKSITVSEEIYDRFHAIYKDNKPNLTTKGINSFTGYITYMLEESMKKDKTFAAYAPMLETVTIYEDRVVLKDNIRNRIVEVVIQQGELFCFMCEEKNCVHVGFVFSIPEVYKILDAKGVKKPA